MRYVVPLMISVVIFIVLLDIISFKYLDKTSENLNKMLTKVQQNIEKEHWEEAQKNIKTVEKEWKNINKKWAMLIEHREIDEIEINMEKLKSYVDTKNKDLSSAQLKAIKMLIRHIPQNEKPILENIL
ncbi:conserved hypothetical protein [Thermoanaerobacter mathranii subsp. mathranii str. A3]|uniref:DUF4363 domain-containing protein n=3 Tax=Thermoanaerobacter TaxID=1754 RepID=D3T725_THEIA|nr:MULTISPECIES: DUF4363 family protein [Thermoanaerobacter]ADD01757.1 conserved hypothetical protein [Thermoanaerobacter italicus Ab9]ADH60296.1 conserved hypothetical protein [Thermoanaerobacter mathranii subsp. mathranii str. A3]MDP9750531.1 putative solute-binding protein [Thermoanaerobacter pentosaceus]